MIRHLRLYRPMRVESATETMVMRSMLSPDAHATACGEKFARRRRKPEEPEEPEVTLYTRTKDGRVVLHRPATNCANCLMAVETLLVEGFAEVIEHEGMVVVAVDSDAYPFAPRPPVFRSERLSYRTASGQIEIIAHPMCPEATVICLSPLAAVPSTIAPPLTLNQLEVAVRQDDRMPLSARFAQVLVSPDNWVALNVEAAAMRGLDASYTARLDDRWWIG